MMKLLQSPMVAMTIGGIAFLATMAALLHRPLSATPSQHEETAEEQAKGFWAGQNQEVDQMLEELRKEKQDLTKRENALKELSARLEAERAELNTITQRVHQLQLEFDQSVVRVKEEELPNLKKLAKLYSNMSPEGASAILNELDDQVVVKVLSLMKEDMSAPLLDVMAKSGEAQAKRAARLTEAIRRTVGEKKKQS